MATPRRLSSRCSRCTGCFTLWAGITHRRANGRRCLVSQSRLWSSRESSWLRDAFRLATWSAALAAGLVASTRAARAGCIGRKGRKETAIDRRSRQSRIRLRRHASQPWFRLRARARAPARRVGRSQTVAVPDWPFRGEGTVARHAADVHEPFRRGRGEGAQGHRADTRTDLGRLRRAGPADVPDANQTWRLRRWTQRRAFADQLPRY